MNFDVDFINDVFVPTSAICHRALYVLAHRVSDLQRKVGPNQKQPPDPQQQEAIKGKCAGLDYERYSLSISMLQLHGSMQHGTERNNKIDLFMTASELLEGIYEILIEAPMDTSEKFEDRSREERICLGEIERLLILLGSPIRNPIPRAKQSTRLVLEG